MTGPTGYDDNNGGAGDGTGQGGGVSPAWNDLLGVVPEEYHEKVTPYLSQWDRNYNNGIQKVHDEYKDWKPITTGFKLDEVQYALQLAQAVSSNPREVYKKLEEVYGQEWGLDKSSQGQGETAGPVPRSEDNPFQEQMNKIQEAVGLLSKAYLTQAEERAVREADAELDREFTALRKTKGDFDEQIVSSLMLGGMSAEQAVNHYQQHVNGALKKVAPQLSFLSGSGGGIPTPNTDVRKMKPEDRRSLGLQMLQAANAQNNQ